MTPMTIRAIAMCALLSPTLAIAQAPPNAASVMVGYNSLKITAKPDSALKVRIDSVDRAIAAATRMGQTAEARRQIARGTALLNRREWTDADDYRQSLVLRTATQFVDPSAPFLVRLEQVYAPAIELKGPLTVRVSRRATPAAAAIPQKLTEYSDVGRDLRDTPLLMSLDVSALDDGVHVLEAEVLDGERSLGTTRLRFAVQKGLDARLAALSRAATSASADVRADLRYPGDYIARVNRWAVDMGTFNVGPELTTAEGVAESIKSGKDPFPPRRGDFERHYELEAAKEILPYRVYVPKSYTGSTAVPIVIGLHGLGGNEDSFMDSYSRRLPELAEKYGYIVATPLGYRSDGFYGFGFGNDAATRRKQALSEQDVLEVLALMRKQYRIDENRIYLMGHSMGAIGTWHLGAKHAGIWAALGAFSGLGDPSSVARMKHIPQFVVHGDADPTVAVAGSRRMVDEMKKLAVDHQYIEVAGGNHNNVVVPNMEAMFEFFEARRRAVAKP